jgi:hypothetical protein
MSISFQCPSCGKKIKAPDKFAGKRSSCPNCHDDLKVPNPVQRPIQPPIVIGELAEGSHDEPNDVSASKRKKAILVTLCIVIWLFVLVGGVLAYILFKPIDDHGLPVPQLVEEKGFAVPAEFGDEIRVGDLLVSIEIVYSGNMGGKFRGQWKEVKGMYVVIVLKNTNPGKILNWPGWQNKGFITDEHGNRFSPTNQQGWVDLPHNWDESTDFACRVDPGTTLRRLAFYQYAPPTSKEAILTLPLDNRVLTFRGLIGEKEKLANDKALKAKVGMVLNASDLFRDLSVNSKTIETDFPRGCTMRVTGVVYVKGLYYFEETGSEIKIKCEPSGIVTCYIKDRNLFNRLKAEKKTPGQPASKGSNTPDRITLQGTLRGFNRAEATLDGCVEVK